MKLKDISPENRPLERLLSCGPESLSNAELLALIIKTGTKKENVLNISQKILTKISIKKLSSTTTTELMKIEGIGKVKACQILSIAELSKRINYITNTNNYKIYQPKDVYDYLIYDFDGLSQEKLIALYMNSKNEIISKKIVSIGTDDQTLIPIKEITTYALKEQAKGVIITHNHPSGDPSPSSEDKYATKNLKTSLKLLELQLIDHVIFGKNSFFSFKEKQLI
jgi:DNA repair protein RadC